MRFWTDFSQQGSSILYRGYEDGKRVQRKVRYRPYLFINDQNGDFSTLEGKPVAKKQFNSIYDAKEFITKNKGMSNNPIYGYDRFDYVFIADSFKDDVEFDPSLVKVANIDIEVAGDEGFPSPMLADKPITAITVKFDKDIVAFGCGDFDAPSDVTYIKCNDEADLINKFLDIWTGNYPDIITGWNISGFDIPFLVNRITRLFGAEIAAQLSPWRQIREKKFFFQGREKITYSLIGLQILDYQDLFKKMAVATGAVNAPDDYKLDTVAFDILGERKVQHEYGSLLELYRKDFQTFMIYNIKDVLLVDRIDQKLKIIDQVITMAYLARANYEDMLGSVNPWTALAHFEMMAQKKVFPPRVSLEPRELLGGYVKDPKPGAYDWVVTFDLNSLYPMLVCQYNISPETMRGKLIDNPMSVEQVVDGSLQPYASVMKERNVTTAANLMTYDRSEQGFLPRILQKIYDQRVKFKDEAKATDKKIQALKKSGVTDLVELEKQLAKFKNLDKGYKVFLNSAYGVLNNVYFILYNFDNAEAITHSGRLSIMWIAKEMNQYLNRVLKTENHEYVIGADTDSMFLNLQEIADRLKKAKPGISDDEISKQLDTISDEKLRPFIDKTYERLAEYVNAREQKMTMKRESICFLGTTKIETINGPVAIQNIKIGDMVLTHKGRYRPVNHIFKNKYDGEMVHLFYGRQGHLRQHIKATPEHPILVERDGIREWIPIKDVVEGDTVFTKSKHCPKTNDVIPFWCKRSNRWNAAADDPIIQQKILETKKSQGCNIEKKRGSDPKSVIHRDRDIIPFCRQKIADGWLMVPIDPKAIPDAIGFKDGRFVLFEIERSSGKLREWKMGKYKNSPVNEFVDEIEWISTTPERKLSRSVWYEDAGDGFVKVKVTSVESRKINWPYGRNYQTVFNIEVNEDNTYVAGGLVVHNCSRAIFLGKKNYILNILNKEGVAFAEPKIDMKGIAAVKSSTPSSCRQKLKDAIKCIMQGDEAAVIKLISDFRREHMTLSFDEIAFPKTLNHMTKYYDKTTLYKPRCPAHVRAALLWNRSLNDFGLKNLPTLQDGDKPKFVYLKTPNPIRENLISSPGPLPPEMKIMQYIDRNTMFEKGFIEPLKRIMDAIGWQMKKSSSLEDRLFG